MLWARSSRSGTAFRERASTRSNRTSIRARWRSRSASLAVAALLHRRVWMAGAPGRSRPRRCTVTTGLWFVVLIGVAAVALDHPARRLAMGGALVGRRRRRVRPLGRGPFAASMTPMDDAWLAARGVEGLALPDAWPAWAWMANLALPAVLWWVHRRRTAGGSATPRGRGARVGRSGARRAVPPHAAVVSPCAGRCPTAAPDLAGLLADRLPRGRLRHRAGRGPSRAGAARAWSFARWPQRLLAAVGRPRRLSHAGRVPRATAVPGASSGRPPGPTRWTGWSSSHSTSTCSPIPGTPRCTAAACASPPSATWSSRRPRTRRWRIYSRDVAIRVLRTPAPRLAQLTRGANLSPEFARRRSHRPLRGGLSGHRGRHRCLCPVAYANATFRIYDARTVHSAGTRTSPGESGMTFEPRIPSPFHRRPPTDALRLGEAPAVSAAAAAGSALFRRRAGRARAGALPLARAAAGSSRRFCCCTDSKARAWRITWRASPTRPGRPAGTSSG